MQNDDDECFLNEFKIVRAHFKNETDYSKIHENSFKFTVRQRRDDSHNYFNKGKLVQKFFNRGPKFCLCFKRNDQVLANE